MNLKENNIDRRLRDFQLRSRMVNRIESPDKKINQLTPLVTELADLMITMRALPEAGSH